jgi:hypothetical protein
MVTAQNNRPSSSRTHTGEGIALLGVLLAFAGIVLIDTAGINTFVAGLGVAFTVTGSTYALAAGRPGTRLSLTLLAAFAVPLLLFSATVQLVGIAGVAVALAGSAYTRYR